MEISLKEHLPEKGTYFVALGNHVKTIINSSAEERDDSMTKLNLGNPNKTFFRGRCSLPFFFKGVSEFKKINTSKQV